MNTKKYTIYIIICILTINRAFAQKDINTDSLRNLLKTNLNDTAYISVASKLAGQLSLNSRMESKKLADSAYNLILKKEPDISYKPYINLAQAYRFLGEYNTSSLLYSKGAEMLLKAKMFSKYVQIMNQNAYNNSMIKECEYASVQIMKCIEIAEQQNLTKQIPETYMFAGYIFRNCGNMAVAKRYFRKSIEASEARNDSNCLHYSLHEYGNLFINEGKHDSALIFQLKAMKIREKINKGTLLYSYNDIAANYVGSNKLEIALEYLEKAEKLAGADLFMLANIYMNKSSIYLRLNELTKSEIYATKALEINKNIQGKDLYIGCYSNLASISYERKDYKSAYDYLSQCFAYKDSLKEENIAQITSELDKKYESVKKDKKLIENSEKIKRQNILIIVFISGFLMVVAFSFLLIRQIKLRKKAYDELKMKNIEIEMQKEEIIAQRDEIEIQRNGLFSQNEIIEEKNKKITDSITYARRIQEAILPQRARLTTYFPNNFILYFPRDIVSGDFYYCMKTSDSLIVAAADCTGHGVSGAFMSMLGMAFLNEIITVKNVTKPQLILDELRTLVKNSLGQTGKFGETQDGMDISLISIHLESKTLSFAGAHNSLWIFRSKNTNLPDFQNLADLKTETEFIELSADRQPVGIYTKERPFTEHTLQLQDNDVFYLSSDGYSSQFGGIKNEKYKKNRMKLFLESIQQKDMQTQMQLLEKEFYSWKGNCEQTDDVLVMGIRV